jgi:serine/threonine-protein kinase 11
MTADAIPAPFSRTPVVNGYALVTHIGSGSRSQVHLAVRQGSITPFAVKSVPVGFDWTSFTLQREIRLHRWLTHPNLVKLHEVFHARRTQTAYLFLEWAAYGPLSAFVGQHLPEMTIASIFAQVASALAYLHGQGMVHPHVKPSNVLLFNGIAKLSDLRICQPFESADSIVGSPLYQPPENFFEGEDDFVVDPVKEDVWSLGISMYETAFGRRPYEMSQDILSAVLEIPSGISDDFRDLLVRMLDVNQESRLTLEQVRNHRFFKDVEPSFSLPGSPGDVPAVKSSLVLEEVAVCQCDEDYTFEGMHQSRSWVQFQDKESHSR